LLDLLKALPEDSRHPLKDLEWGQIFEGLDVCFVIRIALVEDVQTLGNIGLVLKDWENRPRVVEQNEKVC